MIYTCTESLANDLDITADVHDGHAYLRKVVWQGMNLLPTIVEHPRLLADLEERVWQRWFADYGRHK